MSVIQKIEKLREELGGRYQLGYERHNLCGRQISVACAEDAEALFSRRIHRDDLDRLESNLPYWVCVWSSSLALSRVVMNGNFLAAGTSVLELGCGLGLVSAAACLKRARVTASDCQPDALLFARMNCLQIAGIDPEVRVINWGDPPEDRRYATLLCSDLVYDPLSYDPLLACFEILLETGGRVLLSEPNREMGRLFFDRLDEVGWVFEEISESEDVTVYSIQRSYRG